MAAMVNLDLPRFLPTKAYSYLAALLPGLFFEISVMLANPQLVSRLLADFQEVFSLARYLTLAAALFLAFVIGNGFMVGITLVQRFLIHVYRLGAYIWTQLCSLLLAPLTLCLLKNPLQRRPKIRAALVRLNRYAVLRQFPGYGNLKAIDRCMYEFARELVRTKYGINPENIRPDEWPILFVTLAKPSPEESRGSTLMIATHAAGWCGLAATRFAPALEHRYYVAFCLLMIACGLFHDFYVAYRFGNVKANRMLNLRGLIRELRSVPKGAGHQLDTNTES